MQNERAMREHNVEIAGQRYSYYLAGKGKKTVVIIHGLTEDKVHMAQILSEISDKNVLKGYRLLIPDLPGHGGIPLYGMSTEEDYARYLLRLIRHLKINDFALLGFSYGGLVCLSISRLSKRNMPLVLWASHAAEMPSYVKLCMRFLGILPGWLYRIGVHTPIGWFICWLVWGGYARHAWKSAKKFDNMVARTARSGAEPVMLGSENPKLFLFGTGDPLIQEDAAQRVLKLKPRNSEIITVRKGGHAFSNEGIDEAFRIICSFLKRNL